MRLQIISAPLALVLLLSASPLAAQQATDASPPAPAAAATLPATKPDPTNPLEAAIQQRVLALKGRGGGATDRAHADQLNVLYAERSMKPIWVAETGGFLVHGELVRDELAKAGDWGLDVKSLNAADAPPKGASPDTLAAAEMKLTLAVLTYARHARGGRVDPSQLSQWLDQKPRAVDAKALLWSLATSSDPAATLRNLHPRHPGFESLRQAYLAQRGTKADPVVVEPITIPPGPLVKSGDRHEHVALVRKRLKVAAEAGTEDRYDEKLEAAVRAFMAETTGKRLGAIGKEVRAALNSRATKPKETSAGALRRLLVNMERWRWLPDDLGKVHVWNNLPEFETRFVKGGKSVHQERIIIGKADMQTPVFSDRIRYVVFRPEWGVPPSLKVKDLLPKLQNGDYDVLERRNMRISLNGRMGSPENYDWSKVDIRKVPIVQEPGDENPLGHMKFMFPNRHDVYMHDTPSKKLFDSSQRTFSSGCIRVRNPRKFADLIFSEAGGLDINDIQTLSSSKGQDNNKVDLERAIPVHNVYFTAFADEAGTIRTVSDIYGHDVRIAAVLLDGRSVSEVAADDPALKLKEKIDELATSGRLNEDAPQPTRRSSIGERPRASVGDPYRSGAYSTYRSSGYYSQPYRSNSPRYYYQQRPPKTFFDQMFGN